MKAKLAHLFLVLSDLNHEILWRRFFNRHGKYHSIYVHAKWPHQITSKWLRNRLIADRCETAWGKASLVEAELLLLKAALRDAENQFFLLHSESCVPIRPFEFIYDEIVNAGRSWLNYHQANMERYETVNRFVIHKSHFQKCSQFFCLTRAHAKLLLRRLNMKDWQSCRFADEHCMATTLSQNRQLCACARRDITFAHWPHLSASPVTFHTLSDEQLRLLRCTSALFARKFAVDSDIAKYVPLPFPGHSPA